MLLFPINPRQPTSMTNWHTMTDNYSSHKHPVYTANSCTWHQPNHSTCAQSWFSVPSLQYNRGLHLSPNWLEMPVDYCNDYSTWSETTIYPTTATEDWYTSDLHDMWKHMQLIGILHMQTSVDSHILNLTLCWVVQLVMMGCFPLMNSYQAAELERLVQWWWEMKVVHLQTALTKQGYLGSSFDLWQQSAAA